MVTRSTTPTTFQWVVDHHDAIVASIAGLGIAVHLLLRFAIGNSNESVNNAPLIAVLILGGVPVLIELARSAWAGRFGADWLAGISIVASAILGEYLAGALVVLMLSGGEAIEAFAISSASSVLSALAKRVPSVAHRSSNSRLEDIALADVAVGDVLVIFPHEICPVDGTVTAGHGSMDESFLTGEPYNLSKAPGSEVISGALNGEAAITIKATKLAVDSRYAQIMKVMQEGQQYRPRLQRLGDQLGAWYTPLSIAVAAIAWAASGEATRFLAVLVVATPCPLLIAIPVAIIGAISLSARRGIIIKKPIVLEQVASCRTIIFDKTGTLTYGRPSLTEQLVVAPFEKQEILSLVASLERYSKHPLSAAILAEAESEKLTLGEAAEISEPPGQGMRGRVANHEVQVTSRKAVVKVFPEMSSQLPPQAGGLECVILVDHKYAATYQFRDQARPEGKSFIQHLGARHQFNKVMIVSGDRQSEVKYLAQQVGIDEIRGDQSPEQKLEIVRAETKLAPTVFVGDGINDAPALQTATVGIAFGQNSDITSEAAGLVIMETSLRKIDHFLHIGQRMRAIALQSAIGGIVLSLCGMVLAAMGWLPPVAGAVLQEVIDVAAVINAARVAWPPKELSDY